MADEIIFSRDGAVASVTLNRPPVNALGLPQLRVLASTFREIADTADISAVILRSDVPGVFSAGFDLKSNLGNPPVEVNMPGDQMKEVRDTQWAVLECPQPIIVATAGLTLGLGFMLCGLCDVIIAGRSARFGFPEINFGLGGAGHGARILPPPALRYLLLSGRRVPPEYLAQFGTVSEVVDDAELDAAALKLAREIAVYDPLVVRNMKISLDELRDVDVRTRYALEHRWSGLMRFQSQQVGRRTAMETYQQRLDARPS